MAVKFKYQGLSPMTRQHLHPSLGVEQSEHITREKYKKIPDCL